MCKEETWIQDGGEARPEDLLLEQQLDNPILQVAPFLIMIMIVIILIILIVIMIIIVSSEGALYVILPYDYQAAAAATFWTHTGP